MNKIFIGIIIVLIIMIITLCIAIHFLRKEVDKMQDRMISVLDTNAHLHEEIKKLNQVDKIKSDNRKETNEKIDDLHNGELSADDVLPKR